MKLNEYINNKDNINKKYKNFINNKDIDFQRDLQQHDNKIYIFKSKPFKISLALTILLLVISLSMINIKYIREKRIFEEDILNIVELSKGLGDSDILGGIPPLGAFFEYFKYENVKPITFYSIEINVMEYYVIGGYIEEGDIDSERGEDDDWDVDWNVVTWVKYNNKDIIKEKINEKSLFIEYYIYDVLIKKDLLNNINYNKKYKYYSLKSNFNDQSRNRNIKENMILPWWEKLEDIIIFNDNDIRTAFELYESQSSENYIVMDKYYTYLYKDDINKDYTYYNLKLEFGNWYDILINYCIDNEELTEVCYYEDCDIIYNKTMISIEDIKKILIEEEKK